MSNIKHKKIIIVIQDKNPNCEIIEQKVQDFVSSLDESYLNTVDISIHLPECNLINFMNKEKEFTKSILKKRFMVKFNHKLIENITSDKKAVFEKMDRAGNKDIFEVNYDDIIFIDTTPQ